MSDTALGRAIDLARAAHAGQVDKQGRDYFDAHLRPIAEATNAAWPGSWAVQVAWLHDIIEDTDHTAESLLAAGIGPDVVAAVESVTRHPGEPYRDLIERASDSARGAAVKFVDNAWNILCNDDLAARDPEKARSLLFDRYLPARRILVARGAVSAMHMHYIDESLRASMHSLRAEVAR